MPSPCRCLILMILASLTCILFTAASLAQQVTLPLERFDELHRQAETPPAEDPAPPTAAVLERASIDLLIDGDRARVIQRLSLRVFEDGWQTLELADLGPVVAADFGSLDGRLEAANGQASPRLVIRGVGRHSVTLESARQVIADDKATRPSWRLELPTPPAAVVEGQIRLASVDTRADDTPGIDRVELDDASRQHAVLSVSEDGWRWAALGGSLLTLELTSAATSPAVDQPLSWTLETSTSTVIRRSEMRADSIVVVQVERGRLELLELMIPAGFSVLQVSGGTGTTGETTDAGMRLGWQVDGSKLSIAPEVPIDDHLELRLTMTKVDQAAPPVPAHSVIEAPTLWPVDHEVAASSMIRVAVEGDGFLELIDSSEAFRPQSTAELRLAELQTTAPGRPWSLTSAAQAPRWRLTWAEGGQVLAAEIERLLIELAISPAGSAQYRLWAEVRNHGVGEVRMRLPAGAELITASRDGRPVTAGRDGLDLVLPLAIADHPQLFHLSSLVDLPPPRAGEKFDIPLPQLSVPATRVEVRAVLPPAEYCWLDSARQGAVRRPPIPANMTRSASSVDFLAAPDGWPIMEAAWDALTARLPELRLDVRRDQPRKEWF